MRHQHKVTMKTGSNRLAAAAFCFNLLAGQSATGQTFTNSGTLSAALDNIRTNLVITYGMTTNQGWVPLFSADRLDKLATSAQPVDLAPGSRPLAAPASALPPKTISPPVQEGTLGWFAD